MPLVSMTKSFAPLQMTEAKCHGVTGPMPHSTNLVRWKAAPVRWFVPVRRWIDSTWSIRRGRAARQRQKKPRGEMETCERGKDTWLHGFATVLRIRDEVWVFQLPARLMSRCWGGVTRDFFRFLDPKTRVGKREREIGIMNAGSSCAATFFRRFSLLLALNTCTAS